MTTTTFDIAVLGPRGSGKTVYISSLFYAAINLSSEDFSANFLSEEKEKEVKSSMPAHLQSQADLDEWTQKFISQNWKNLFEKQEFSHIEGTNRNWHLLLEIQGKRKNWKVVFHDIPGGWFSEEKDWSDETRQIRSRMEKCDAAILVLDAVQLTQNELEYGEHLHTFIRALDEVYREKSGHLPVAVVFTKCDEEKVQKVSNEQLIERVQGVVNRLETTAKTKIPLGSLLQLESQYQIFRTSAIGQLEYSDEYPKGRPPKGGPVKNELFFNLQRSLYFLLEYKQKVRHTMLWKGFVAAIALLVCFWCFEQYRIYQKDSTEVALLEKKLQEESDIETVMDFADFFRSRHSYFYQITHQSKLNSLYQKYKEMHESEDTKMWQEIKRTYQEAPDTISLTVEEYQDWKKQIGKYLQYFSRCQDKAQETQQLIHWKILASKALKEEKDSADIQDLMEKWRRIEANSEILRTLAREHVVRLEEQQITLALKNLSEKNFPDPFLDTFAQLIHSPNTFAWKPRLAEMLEKKLKSVFTSYREEDRHDEVFVVIKKIKSKLPWETKLPQSQMPLGQFLEREEANTDYLQRQNYLKKNASSIPVEEQLKIWQEHLDRFSQSSQHRDDVLKTMDLLIRQQEISHYQKLEEWINQGNRGDYRGLLEKINTLQQKHTRLSRDILVKIEKLKEQTRRYEIQTDFDEVISYVKKDEERQQFSKAAKRLSDFISGWKLQYGMYPEAEELIQSRAEPTLIQVKERWRLSDYEQLYENFNSISTMVAVEECIELCTLFLRDHGFDQSVSDGKKFLQKVRRSNEYTIKLSHGKHLTNRMLVANLIVEVYHHEEKIFQSKEYDSNTPTWNEEFSIDWKAFDPITVKVLDKNGRDAWIYNEASDKVTSITDILDGTKANKILEIVFEFPKAPKFLMTSPLEKQKEWQVAGLK